MTEVKKKSFLNFNIKNDNNVLIICVVIIVVILVIALLASVVKNRKVDIEADLTIASAGTSCDLIVREDDGRDTRQEVCDALARHFGLMDEA